jgi:hypothetical protein
VTDHDIRVGLSVSVSGRFKLQGQQALSGVLLWQSHANAQGGISIKSGVSRSVRLVWDDIRCLCKFSRKITQAGSNVSGLVPNPGSSRQSVDDHFLSP